MQQRTINGSLPITARLLADDLGIKTHFGAEGFACFQDDQGGKHLYIPNLPAEDDLASALALGGIVHEDGHFSETDLLLMQSITDGFLHDLTNILEDIRIEQHQIRKYAGAKSILAKMIRAMVDTGSFRIDPEKAGLVDVLFGYVVCELRVKVLQQEALVPRAFDAANLLEGMLPADAFAKLTDMMFTVRETKSTVEVLTLAKQIFAMLQQESQQQSQPKPQPEESAGDGQPESDHGDSQPDEPEGSGESDAAQGDGQPESDQGESNDSRGGGDQSDESKAQEESGAQSSQTESGNQGAGQSNGQSDDQSEAEGQEAAHPNGSANDQSQGGSDGASNGATTNDNPDLGGSDATAAGDTHPANQGDVGGDTNDGTEPTTGEPIGEFSGADAKAEALAGLLADDDLSSKKWDMANVIAELLGDRMLESGAGAVRLPDGIPMHLEAGNGEDVLARLRAETNAVRRKTLGLLEAQARTKILNGRSGNRLDARRLWKTRMGDCRVFEKRVEGHKQDTAIQLLVDR